MVDSEEHITVPRDLRTDGQDTVSWLGLREPVATLGSTSPWFSGLGWELL